MYSSILRRFVLPLGDIFFGGNYLKTLKKWNTYDTLPESTLLDIQKEKLEQILRYTLKNVPYYKNIAYDEDISSYENLKKFPILTKELLRKERENLVSEEFNINDLKKNFSSGSSGIQSYSYSEKKNVFYLQGLSYHWYMWGGFGFGNSVLQFGISPNRTLPKKLKDIFFRVNYQEAFSLNDSDYKRIYNDLKKDKTEFIIGYPSAINQLAEYLNKNNLQHSIKTIISLGDKLFGHFEDNFIKAFDNPLVIDTYGCAEGFLIACRYDTPYYYISAPHVYVEIVDDNGQEVEDGELGHVLVTCFTNLAQPFIRYKLGDLAVKLPKEKYPKDRKFQYPLLERIVGRETDVVKTPNGKTLIVHSFTGIIEYYPDIKQYQIIQESINEIVIKYITDNLIPLKDNTLQEIEHKINILTDNTVKVIFEKTDFIANSPSGKPQIIKSLL
jgi:phenylacetate-CoA ligase